MDTQVLLTTAVVGVVEFIKAIADGNYRTAILIFFAALAGASLARYIGIDPISGMFYGLTGTSLVTVANKVGGK